MQRRDILDVGAQAPYLGFGKVDAREEFLLAEYGGNVRSCGSAGVGVLGCAGVIRQFVLKRILWLCQMVLYRSVNNHFDNFSKGG